MSSLYELTAEYQQLLDMAEDPDVDPQTLTDTMEAIGGEIEDKADGCAKVIKELSTNVAAKKAEAQRLLDSARSEESNIKRIKANLLNAMVVSGKRKFKTRLWNFAVVQNPVSVVIPDESRVPEEYLKAKIEIDKSAIKEALKSGAEFDWAKLESTEGVRIR